MLDLMKIYLPTNFRAYMMNFGWITTKKTIYNNMQMSFLAKIAKISLKWLFYRNYDGFCQRNAVLMRFSQFSPKSIFAYSRKLVFWSLFSQNSSYKPENWYQGIFSWDLTFYGVFRQFFIIKTYLFKFLTFTVCF